MTSGRSSCGSEVLMLDDQVTPSGDSSQPSIGSINVTESSRVHIGPQFIRVTQNVDKTRVLRDLPLHRYIWHMAKNTTKAERVLCATAMVILLICILLVVYFTVIAKNVETEGADVGPADWFINKEMWLAEKYNYTETNDDFNPLRLVIVAHTVSQVCTNFIDCAAELRTMQSYFLESLDYDIPYNFLVGNDGRVYEGRGWNIVGAHLFGYNRCSMGLAFVGDYREGTAYTKVTELQQERAHMLFKEGVKLGYLHPDFYVVGAMDLQITMSPGTNLYKAMQKWPHYDHNKVYTNRTCEEVREMFKNENLTSLSTIPTTSVDFT